jgi:hypothetical protein
MNAFFHNRKKSNLGAAWGNFQHVHRVGRKERKKKKHQ